MATRKNAATVRAPRLPKVLHSQLGPVPVAVVAKLKVNGEEVYGHFNGWDRLIRISDGPHPFTQHLSLYHEWMHMVLFDAGLHNVFTKEQQELLCDAVGMARAVELRESAIARKPNHK